MDSVSPGKSALQGLLLTIAQLLLCWIAGGRSEPGLAYLHLNEWDSRHYIRIADQGYPAASQVSFYPAYPMAIRGLSLVSGMSLWTASLVVAQIAAWGFWTYFLILVRRLGATELQLGIALALLYSHPASFFLVAGYSESLFLCSLLGMLTWSLQPGKSSFALAALHGVVMSATRLVGLPFVILPWILASGWRSLLVGILSSLGGLAFLAYCQWQFGAWDLYFLNQKQGWGLEPDFSIFLHPQRVLWPDPAWPSAWRQLPHWLDQVSVSLMTLSWPVLMVWETRRGWPGDWRNRAGCYLGAFLLYIVHVSGLQSVHFRSMMRYGYTIEVLILLATLSAPGLPWPQSKAGRILVGTILAFLIVTALLLQSVMIYFFTRRIWVA